MRNLTLLLFLIIPIFASGQNCAQPINQQSIEGGNIELTLSINDIWWDGNSARYFFPKKETDKVAAIFAGAFWITGNDEEGNFCGTAAQQFGKANGKSDYWAGPTGFQYDCRDWDKHFIVNQADIETFNSLVQTNQLDINNIPENIKAWPANGNPFFEQANGFQLPTEDEGFAEFIDIANDGIYNPLEGDYPRMNGASSIAYWVMNDFGNIHTESEADALIFQIQVTAHVYNSGVEALDNSSVYKVKIINKGDKIKTDCCFGLWMDADLGCSEDDYFGSIPDESLSFIYNSDTIDGNENANCTGGVNTYGEEIPVMGIKFLDLEENNQDDSEMIGFYLSKFGPDSIPGFFGLPEGLGADLLPDSILQSDKHLPFAFTGSPADENSNAMCNELPLITADFRTLNVYGRFNLVPNASHQLAFAVTGIENVPHPCPDITELIDATNVVGDFFTEQDQLLTSTNSPTVKSIYSLSVYPNPTNLSREITVQMHNTNQPISSYELMSVSGVVLQSHTNLQDAQLNIPIGNLSAGVYILVVRNAENQSTIQKLVVN